MNERTLVKTAWIAAAAITVLRFAFAAALPMTGDEAYYWEWSRRLAAGYIDHPPAVAYAIALFSWAGRSALAVRLPFVLCGIGTAAAAAGAANAIWKSSRAAAVAALAVLLAPMLTILFVTASPEGPATFAWALALYAGVMAFERRTPLWFALLGIAMGLALLSHFLCWALVAGIAAAALVPQHRRAWRDGLWPAFAICAAMYAPFVAWNAGNGWASFAFALLHRHPSEVQIVRPLATYALCALAFSPGLWLAATVAVRHPRHALVACTGLPLAIVLFALALHERVEAYWFAGPFVSLAIALPRFKTGWILGPAFAMSAILYVAGIAPLQTYAVLSHAGLHLRNAGPFEIFTYEPLAQQAARVARARDAIVMTDGYGFSSLLDFHADIRPVFIGYDAQGQEARRWYGDSEDPRRALFLDKAPLATRPDFQRQLALACGRVETGPVFALQYRTYYSTWCEAMRPGAIAILRFKSSPSQAPR